MNICPFNGYKYKSTLKKRLKNMTPAEMLSQFGRIIKDGGKKGDNYIEVRYIKKIFTPENRPLDRNGKFTEVALSCPLFKQ